ncbi:hypothetical protein FXO38_10266 [Capsicum annuum]|nr:hypothetical protein FXO38_10266 [Capsicum annuum]
MTFQSDKRRLTNHPWPLESIGDSLGGAYVNIGDSLGGAYVKIGDGMGGAYMKIGDGMGGAYIGVFRASMVRNARHGQALVWVVTKTLASLGFIVPEYGQDGLESTKCDVYSYGIMLLETFTRRKPRVSPTSSSNSGDKNPGNNGTRASTLMYNVMMRRSWPAMLLSLSINIRNFLSFVMEEGIDTWIEHPLARETVNEVELLKEGGTVPPTRVKLMSRYVKL